MPSAASQSFTIGTYQWELFEGAIKGIPDIQQHYVNQVIDLAIMDTSGKDKAFWKCMKNALN